MILEQTGESFLGYSALDCIGQVPGLIMAIIKALEKLLADGPDLSSLINHPVQSTYPIMEIFRYSVLYILLLEIHQWQLE